MPRESLEIGERPPKVRSRKGKSAKASKTARKKLGRLAKAAEKKSSVPPRRRSARLRERRELESIA